MKKFYIILIALIAQTTFIVAQGNHPEPQKFDPEEFRQHQHDFISEQAQLTEAEKDVFFPVFDEMKEKERALFAKQRTNKKRPQTDEEYREAISNYDKLDLELKKLQQNYHQKFLKILSPKKVFKVIRAEDMFRTQMFRNMAKRGPRPDNQKRR